MGERSRVDYYLEPDKPPMQTYFHWAGADNAVAVKYALRAAHPRWHDPDYCTRVFLHNLWEAFASADTDTGVGFGYKVCDGDPSYFPVVVSYEYKTVSIDDQVFVWDDYIEMDDEHLQNWVVGA